MRKVSHTFDRELQDQLAFLGFLTPDQRRCLPEWMVIAPPKTGTSWVYANLRQHPEAFAVDLKELKYFSNRFELEDLRNYLSHFRTGVGRTKGEASPSYSLLPVRTIQLIRALVPDLKLIYLMREPISRAWSHARHNCREREAVFKRHTGSLDEVSEEKWIECVADDWNRLSGDYLGQLQRWLSVFPREQVYLGFFEEIVHSPRRLLREILEFLEIDPSFADSENVILERVNVGIPKNLPPQVHERLVAIHRDRTRNLADYLQDEHGMTVPLEWAETLAPPAHTVSNESGPAWVGSWDAGDEELSKLLCQDDLLERDFLGHHIVRQGTGFVAYPISLGIVNPQQFGPQWWTEQLAAGTCLVAANPYDLKSLIVRKTLARDAAGSEVARLRHLEQQLTQVENRQTELRTSASGVTAQLRDLERSQADSNSRAAGLGQSCQELTERVNSLASGQAQLTESVAAARQECRQVADVFQALEQRHCELLEYTRSLRHSHEELIQSRDDLLRTRDELIRGQNELIQGQNELIRSRDDLSRRLQHSAYRLEEAEVELFGLRERVAALENSLVIRTLRRFDAWLITLRLSKPLRPVQEPLAASIDVPNGHPSRHERKLETAGHQTPVDEKTPF
jgi:Sulfotransferase domain